MTGPPQSPPTARQILFATCAALAVAIVLLFGAVLPAEYGIDPLRTGRALGLVRPGAAAATIEPTPIAGDELKPAASGPAASYPATYRTDRVEIDIAPYDYVEYKYRLAQAAIMVYSWEATAPVIADLHGAPDGGAAGREVSIERQTKARASGTLTAPFSGMHGWYWENPGNAAVRVTLTTAGFYTSAVEYRSNRTRLPHEVRKP
jgi:hypothetical protein